MKGRWKWVFLTIGVLLISATCGFGYETRVTRSRFDEAKDAFSKKDWDRVVENLSDLKDPHVPTKKALREFIRVYVEPVLKGDKFGLASREWNSSMVPIRNEEVSYQMPTGTRNLQFIRLIYSDDVRWFDLPIGGRKYGIFQGKQVTLSFYLTFFRVAFERFPPISREERWRSIVDFVRSEKGRLAQMGILPTHVYSKTKTWDEYIKFYEDRAKTYGLETGTGRRT